jgi:Sulfotransferase family
MTKRFLLQSPSVSGTGLAAPARVLFIGGCGRSGSTLLDLMLGEFPGFVSVGELRFIWQRGLVENQRCGCGEPFRECPFWRTIGEEAFGGWNSLDANQLAGLERGIDRHRFIPFLVAPWLWPRYRRRLTQYAEILAVLYGAVARATGGACIVDSTKDPPFAFILRHVPGLDLRVVHLVRDSRGVAFSWTKRIRKPEKTETVDYMNTYHPVEMGFRWMAYNFCFHVLSSLGVPRLSMRYERLVRIPRAEIERIASHLGVDLPDEGFRFLREDGVELGVHHTVSGNPMRFEQGSIHLRVDEDWRTQLKPLHRRLVSICTFPFLWFYGYLGPARGRQ